MITIRIIDLSDPWKYSAWLEAEVLDTREQLREAAEALRQLHAAAGEVPLKPSDDGAATLAFVTARRKAGELLDRLRGVQ